MKAKMVAFIVLALLLALAVTPVYAADNPALPHAFYGTVEVNGSPAPVGTQLEARGEGVQTGVDYNPIEVTVAGQYGGSGGFDPKLVVWGDIADGATVTFYVNGVSTGQTATWHSGEITELNIDAAIEGSLPEPPPGTTEPPPDTTEPPPGTTEPPPDTTEPPSDATEPPSDTTEPPSDESPAPLLPPPPPGGPGGWPILWTVIGGVVLAGLIIVFVVARMRAY
jgi:hypothetical protein